ncbi:hypothetical protein [Ruegeria atlantica]|uniref:hypothetical protein n=1 Tax=Ruegeria atlantica TaxID=81569 RepID=UPI001F45D164|nr:hypothetical protein [Ruegeria atlantica]
MTKGIFKTSEAETQRQFLTTTIGTPGSGAIRYAAAMYFFKIGKLSAEMLEVYRTCSKFDAEDPLDLAGYEGISFPEFVCNLSSSADA